MECIKCQAALRESAKYCSSCGTQNKCLQCGEELALGVAFCDSCGKEVGVRQSSSEKNTFIYQKTKGDVLVKAEFSDQVGSDLAGSIASIILNNHIPQKNKSGADKLGISTANLPSPIPEVAEYEDLSTPSYPAIENVEMKAPKWEENKWVLIYAFYVTEYGRTSTSMSALRERYLKKRNSTNQKKNFSNYFKTLIKRNDIENVGNDSFRFLAPGLDNVKSLLKHI